MARASGVLRVPPDVLTNAPKHVGGHHADVAVRQPRPFICRFLRQARTSIAMEIAGSRCAPRRDQLGPGMKPPGTAFAIRTRCSQSVYVIVFLAL
jgi:hypothetical protein